MNSALLYLILSVTTIFVGIVKSGLLCLLVSVTTCRLIGGRNSGCLSTSYCYSDENFFRILRCLPSSRRVQYAACNVYADYSLLLDTE